MKPVFIDLETRSACDLRARGATAYAKDDSTRLLTVAWQADGVDHVWLPGLRESPPEAFVQLHLPGVRVHIGDLVPADLCRVAHRPWVGHNVATFDRLVWGECTEGFERVTWLDTYPLALSCGLPGGLDKIGKFLFGEGKYESGNKALKKAMRCTREPGDCEPENVPLGQLLLVARYNVQDVRGHAKLYDFLEDEARLTEEEQRVLAAHHAINQRGIRVDRALVQSLIELADVSKARAISQIAALTNGELPDQGAVQSRARVLAWLDKQGFKFHSLKKDLVARFIDANKEDDQYDPDQDETSAVPEDAAPTTLPLVVKVLQLRMQALRITGGKLDAALWSMDEDGRARGLFVYWGAATGRWAGRRIQVQNLPRPKEGVDVWGILNGPTTWERIAGDQGLLATEARTADGKLLYPYLSVDDAASALVRNIFIPDEGTVLAAADYAAIECRVLAWMAKEKWLMDAFWNSECPYLKMAERIVNTPRDKWPEYPDPKTGKPLPLKKHPYRQIIGKVPELAAGYGVGGAKIEMYAAGMGYNLLDYGVTGEDAVIAYRRSHPAICGAEVGEYNGKPYFRGGLWCQLNNAAIETVSTGARTFAGRCTFSRERGCLIVTLPSGRRLVYRDARVDRNQPSYAKGTDKWVDTVTYTHPRYGRKHTYGGYWCENVVQACARDILAAAIVRLEAEGDMPVVLHCHDEAVSCIQESRLPRFMELVTTPPDWLVDFCLDAEGSCAPRYAKSPPPGVKDVLWRNGRAHNA